MTDDDLRHLCKLGSIAVGALCDKAEWIDFMSHADERELTDQYTCLSILADAFVELMNRQGMKPKIRMPHRLPDHLAVLAKPSTGETA